MCNYCNCSNDAYDQCSMLGHMLEGFCCEICVGHENRHECEHYGLKFMTKVIPNSQHISISSSSEAKTQEKEEKINLIINKDRWFTICNNCNCDAYDKCSIVGYMPVGFCCSKCVLYDEIHTCLKTKSKPQEVQIEESERFQPISTEIEGGLLKVVISKKDKKIPIVIDIQKQLESK